MSDLVEVTIVATGNDLGAWLPITMSCGHSSETLNFGAPKLGDRVFCTDCSIERFERSRASHQLTGNSQ